MQRGFLVNAETRHAAFIKGHLNEADPSSFAAENYRHANLEDDTFRHLVRYASDLRRAFSATWVPRPSLKYCFRSKFL